MPTLLSINPAPLTAFALNIFLAVTVVTLVALVAVRLVFRHNPSARYYLCLIGLIAILASPLIVTVQDHMGFSLVTLSLPASLSASAIAEVSPVAVANAGVSAAIQEVSPALIVGMVGIFLTIWAAGVLWGTVRLIRGWRQVAHLTEGMQAWDSEKYAPLRANTSRILGCVLPPIYTASQVDSPVAVGLLRPMVILPAGLAEALLPVQLQQILLHECAHIVHRHMLGGMVERITRLLFWMHPLVSLLCLELARSREEVCDNVASQEVGAACYARTLLALAQGTLPAPPYASTLALLGPETSLEQRISGLLHPRRNRMVRMKQGKLWAITGVAVLALVSMVAVRVVAATGNISSDTTPTVRLGELKTDHEHVVEIRLDSPLRLDTADTTSRVVSLKLDKKQSPNGEWQIQQQPAGYLEIKGKGTTPKGEDQWVFVQADQERYTVQLEQKKDDLSVFHQFLSHIHQMFGGIFAAFHHQSDEYVTEKLYTVKLDGVGEQSTTFLDKFVEKPSER